MSLKRFLIRICSVSKKKKIFIREIKKSILVSSGFDKV
jgi:hypothetical protein